MRIFAPDDIYKHTIIIQVQICNLISKLSYRSGCVIFENCKKDLKNIPKMFCNVYVLYYKITIHITDIKYEHSPVNTTFPETNISNTIRGLTILYIRPGNSSGSYDENWPWESTKPSNLIGNLTSQLPTIFWILKSRNFA